MGVWLADVSAWVDWICGYSVDSQVQYAVLLQPRCEGSVDGEVCEAVDGGGDFVCGGHHHYAGCDVSAISSPLASLARSRALVLRHQSF